MRPVDLVDYAQQSEKIPKDFLSNIRQSENTGSLRLIFAYAVDLILAFIIANSIDLLLKMSTIIFMATHSMQEIYTKNVSAPPFTFPIVLCTYYFCCFFMNHGQSWGMHLIKRRHLIENNKFIPALKASLLSTIIGLTFGFALFLVRQRLSIVPHDYLYHDLMTPKVSKEDLIVKNDEAFAAKEEEVKEVAA